jgi:ABC-type spermidine/putrescine transport system permease subunit I
MAADIKTLRTGTAAPPPRAARRHLDGWRLLLIPTIAFLLIFFLYPLIFVGSRSLPGFSFQFYASIATIPVYLKVIIQTFQTSAIVTVVCLLLGYPYAYAMARSRGWTLTVLSICLLLPFWVSLLLRTFAWMVLLQDTGIINTTLLDAGIISEPLHLIRNILGVSIGMTHILLPYVVLPIYSVMSKIDSRLMEAASISGARPTRAFCRVYFPLSLPGVFAGALLAFTLGLGFYITPALLGGARNTLIAQLIADQISQQFNFGFGSALAIVLLLLTGLAFGLFGLFLKVGRHQISLSGV